MRRVLLASGDVRYCILGDLLGTLDAMWEGPVSATTTGLMDRVLADQLPDAVNEPDRELGRVKALALREGILAVLRTRT